MTPVTEPMLSLPAPVPMGVLPAIAPIVEPPAPAPMAAFLAAAPIPPPPHVLGSLRAPVVEDDKRCAT